MFQARPGGGASVAGDGWPCGGEMQCAASVKFGSLELTEVRFPLFFRRHEFRPDSAGDGKHRGAVGTVLELQVESDGPAWANTAGDGTRHAPYGVLGGNEGLPHHYRLYTDGQYRVLKTKETMVPVHPGDVLMVEASGGGGWGNPSDRPKAVRAADVVNEFVTANGTVATPVS
jgi:N-methylhydantoinase B